MDEKFETIYADLLRNEDPGLGSGLPEEERVENCFKICLDHWEAVKQIVREDGFSDDAAEIRFFKWVKPRFTGRLEYYTLVYQYGLFCPREDATAALSFWTKEQAKIVRFRVTQASLIAYYRRGSSELDEELFLRRHYKADPTVYTRVFDREEDFLTSGDWVLTQWRGYELYEGWLAEKLNQ